MTNKRLTELKTILDAQLDIHDPFMIDSRLAKELVDHIQRLEETIKGLVHHSQILEETIKELNRKYY